MVASRCAEKLGTPEVDFTGKILGGSRLIISVCFCFPGSILTALFGILLTHTAPYDLVRQGVELCKNRYPFSLEIETKYRRKLIHSIKTGFSQCFIGISSQ